MRKFFEEYSKANTGKQLEITSGDYVFYSSGERLLTLKEPESWVVLNGRLSKEKKNIEDFAVNEKEPIDTQPPHQVKLSDLTPRKNYWVTPILIYLNILIFLVTVLSGVNFFEPDALSLLKCGGNLGVFTANGQYWRLLSSTFLHAGVLHLLFNMIALLYVGSVLERVIGQHKFIFAYFVSGIIASISSILVHSNVVSVGASGAIFGLFGLILALLLFKQFKFADISTKSLLTSVMFFVGYNILYGFSETGIDNAAHIGGLISGFIIGVFYSFATRMKIKEWVNYAALCVLFGIISVLAIQKASGGDNGMGKYYITIEKFIDNERKTLWIDETIFSDIPEEKVGFYKKRLQKDGVDVWKSNIILLEGLKKRGYAENINNQIDLLIEYSALRVKFCELNIELLENDSVEVQKEISKIIEQINNKLTEVDSIQIEIDN